MMKEHYKAVFLPADERILCLYKGYILNGNMMPYLKKEDVENETVYYTTDDEMSKLEKFFRLIFLLPFIPLFIIFAVIAFVFKQFDRFSERTHKVINNIFGFFFRRKKIKNIRTEKKIIYKDVVEENVLELLIHCQNNQANVFIYSYSKLSIENSNKVSDLIKNKLITAFVNVEKISDLQSLIISESVSLHNSFILITSINEAEEVERLGFATSYSSRHRGVELLGKRDLSYKGPYPELIWNSAESVISIKRNITYYLQAKDRLFFTNDIVLFVEDDDNVDQFLNNYVSKNLSLINKRLIEKNIQLLYFPSINKTKWPIFKGINDFLRYRIPILYTLSDAEIESALNLLIKQLSAKDFYRLVLTELELPYFKKPALLRNITSGWDSTINKFTYKTIEYSTEKELDSFFDWYINQVKIPAISDEVMFSRRVLPAEYDADEYFDRDAKEDSLELKNQIDSVMAQGKFGAIAEVLMYLLETIKEDRPDLLAKVKPLIEKRQLLESKVILSSLYVDKKKKIILPEFGNVEVKMHALPKTVYLFYLQHPEGVRIKELYQFKKELLEIYNTLTNKDENEEIHRAINDLVDMKKPNINMQCSRIRAAFRSIMDEHIAKYYYIDGQNGEPKKIALPQNLIDIRY